MSPDQLLLLYVVLTLGALTLVVIYHELRRKRFEPRPTEDHIFRCAKCSFVYTDDHDVELSRCPHCGAMNEEIKF
jgi:rubrerythrin